MLRETFTDFLQIEKRYSPHTQQAYLRDLKELDTYLQENHQFSLFDKIAVRRINHRSLRIWMGSLLNAGNSSRTVSRKISSVKAYFNFLQKSSILDKNPARQLKAARFEQKLPAFLKETETEHLLEGIAFAASLEGARDRCLLEVLYGCGLRRSELIGLAHEDVDFYQRNLRVRGKGNKDRILPFGKAVEQSMKAYLVALKEAGLEEQGPFFVRKNGQALYPKLVYRIVNTHLSRVSSLRQKSPHVLRHSFATHLLDHGADLNAIKELLGHESLAATQVYTHNTISKLKSIHQQAHPRAEHKNGE